MDEGTVVDKKLTHSSTNRCESRLLWSGIMLTHTDDCNPPTGKDSFISPQGVPRNVARGVRMPPSVLDSSPTSCQNSGPKKRDGFCTLPNALRVSSRKMSSANCLPLPRSTAPG
ncbi:hypothetical protein CEXT_662511 [Caerostris extrusa]|uniref:Uncharacterized protein n=1 Tax=Caerostris extrusa TaxID=172846 RepID=A0AAV4VCZ2_CAEEX|nr:hypothetical protein CEXT_662511 [Caerostris extrusa]